MNEFTNCLVCGATLPKEHLGLHMDTLHPVIPMQGPTGIEKMVCEDIARRQQHGKQKYGVEVISNQLTDREWMQHHYEELLDACIYVRMRMYRYDEGIKQAGASGQ